jgi:NitT/TauT family transport system substrate-binding protein
MKISSAHPSITAAVAALAVSALTLSACSSQADSTSANGISAVSVSYFANTLTGLPVEVAEQEGFFKENSLDITIQSGTSGPALLQAIVAGQSDVAMIPASVAATALVQGSKVKAIVGGGGGSTIVVANRVNVPGGGYPDSAQALAGKTIAITAPGGYSDQLFKFIQKDADVPGMKYVTVAGVAENIAALQSGRVDALNLDPVSAIRVQRMNLGQILYDLQATGPEKLLKVPAVYGWANGKFADGKTSAAFAKSIAQAVEWIHDPANSTALEARIKTLLGDQKIDITEDELNLVRGAFVAYVDPAGLSAIFAMAGAAVDPADVIAENAPTSQTDIEALVGE